MINISVLQKWFLCWNCFSWGLISFLSKVNNLMIRKDYNYNELSYYKFLILITVSLVKMISWNCFFFLGLCFEIEWNFLILISIFVYRLQKMIFEFVGIFFCRLLNFRMTSIRMISHRNDFHGIVFLDEDW